MNPEYIAYLRDCWLSGEMPMSYENWLETMRMLETYNEPRGTQVRTMQTVERSKDELCPVTACA